MARWFWNFWPAFLVALAIFYASACPKLPDVMYLEENNVILYQTDEDIFTTMHIRDMVGHALAYMLLTLTLCYGLCRMGVSFGSVSMWGWAVVFPLAYGLLLEYAQQAFFPPRTAEWVDCVSDTVGVVAGYYVAKAYMPVLCEWICNYKNKRV